MSKALILILNDLRRLDEVHQIFFKHACGATTLDSAGLGKALIANEIALPDYADWRALIEHDKPYHKTIISVIRSEEKLRSVIRALRESLDIDSTSNHGSGFMFVLPVDECFGYALDQSDTDS